MPWVTHANFIGSRNSQRGCCTSGDDRSDILWETSESGPHSYNGTNWVDGGFSYYGTGISGGKGACGTYGDALVAGGYGTTPQTTSCLFNGTSYIGGPTMPNNKRYCDGSGVVDDGRWDYDLSSTSSGVNANVFNGTTWASSSRAHSAPSAGGVIVGGNDDAVICAGYIGYTTPVIADDCRTWNGTTHTVISLYPTNIHRQSGFGASSDAAWVTAGEYAGGLVTAATYLWNGTSWVADDDLGDTRDNHGGNGNGNGGWVIQGYTAGNSPAYPTYEYTFSRTVLCDPGAIAFVGAGDVLQQPGRAHIISVVPDSFGDAKTGIVITTQHITTTGAKVYIRGVEQTVTGTTADSITFTSVQSDTADGDYALVVVEGP